MSPRCLFTVENLNLSIGEQIIFDDASLAAFEGERIALIGRNGSGKTTLLKVISGSEIPLDTKIARERDLRIAAMPQDFQLDDTLSARENIRTGLEWFYELQRLYETKLPAAEHDRIEEILNRYNAWHLEHKLDEIMEKLHLPDEAHPIANASGGEKRRIALARAIISEPDLLLLDEPTNHLDVETIEWIENFLAAWRGTALFITHDRRFLDKIATRVVELDHGKIYSYPGNYADYLAGRAERLEAADAQENRRQSFLRREIEWVRRSPKARMKRNMGRLRRYEEIAAQSGPVRDEEIDLVIPRGARMGNMILEMKNVSLNFGEREIIKDFNFEFSPGCRLGVVGPNGAGKTTFLRLITGALSPDSGTIRVAPTVQFNYVDQSRVLLNEEKSVLEEISEGLSTVQLGSESISVWTYLRRFLFDERRINTKINRLSGGEKARLALAKILLKGGNFLLLDEPTNDLDLSSLRLLEEALLDFNGCLIAVSHDRYFLNRISTHILGFDGEGKAFFTPGDYDYYLEKRPQKIQEQPKEKEHLKVQTPPPAPPAKKKLSFKEQKELEGMEERIAAAEEKVAEYENMFSSPDFFAQHGTDSAKLQQEFENAQKELAALYSRWEELETKAAECKK
ncbi:MAG: ABC-F family ATP-binding cassette domain-containing protein [Lentisphaerae bacterium]|nr:ABC-F family ATP-binding cassette domain-containing protein [Lentisphaerota bacterium]